MSWLYCNYQSVLLQKKKKKRFYLFIFREGKGERKRRKTSMCGCPSHIPSWGPGLQPRYVPQTGSQLAPLWFASTQSTEPHQVGPNMCSLIPSPFHLFPQSHCHQTILCIYDSISGLLVCLVCLFLASVVDRYVFIAILLFIILILFLLKKSL